MRKAKEVKAPFAYLPPKKMTKGVRRQIARLLIQNPAEAERQKGMVS